MAVEKTLVDALQDLVDYRLLSLFTMIPAIVKKVNYAENHLNASPLIKTKYLDGSQQEGPELFDVPIFILSANSGKARITLPVKVGDTVLILYSQRDLEGFYESDGKTVVDTGSTVTHGSYPIMALPCLFTKSSAKSISSSNVEIENGATKITIKPSGDVVVDAGTLRINADLEVNGDATFNGTSTLNGVTTVTANAFFTAAMDNNGVNIGGTHDHEILGGSSAPGPTGPAQ